MKVISKMIGVVSVAPQIIYFSYKTGFWTFSRGGCLLILSSVAACYNAWWYNMVARKGHCVISFSFLCNLSHRDLYIYKKKLGFVSLNFKRKAIQTSTMPFDFLPDLILLMVYLCYYFWLNHRHILSNMKCNALCTILIIHMPWDCHKETYDGKDRPGPPKWPNDTKIYGKLCNKILFIQ